MIRHGRGQSTNPPNRFERFHLEEDPEALEPDERRSVATEFFRDHSRTVLSKNKSPDVAFSYSLNPYRGCEHGCVYCYARPTHEFLGYSAGLDFETKILVKENAPGLLAAELERPSWQPQVIALAGNTDVYQPVERRLALTRACLQVLLAHANPVSVITKNYLVTRDLDILAEMASLGLVHVTLSITSLRDEVIARMEPRTSRPARRLKAIERLAEVGIPVSVLVAPLVPGLTDEELPAILRQAADAGATSAGYVVLRLPGLVEPLFMEWLGRTFPERRRRVEQRLRALRGGRLSDSSFGARQTGEGAWARLYEQMFGRYRRAFGLEGPMPPLQTRHFRRAARTDQLSLF